LLYFYFRKRVLELMTQFIGIGVSRLRLRAFGLHLVHALLLHRGDFLGTAFSIDPGLLQQHTQPSDLPGEISFAILAFPLVVTHVAEPE
jgi:hypothetical protein